MRADDLAQVQYEVPTDFRSTVTVIRDSRKSLVAAIALLSISTIASVLLIAFDGLRFNPHWAWQGLVALAGSSLAVTFCAWRLGTMRPRMIVDETGITDFRHGYGFIPWANVVNARIARQFGAPFLCVKLSDSAIIVPPSKWQAMDRAWMRLLTTGPDEIAISLKAVGTRPHLILETVQRQRSRAF